MATGFRPWGGQNPMPRPYGGGGFAHHRSRPSVPRSGMQGGQRMSSSNTNPSGQRMHGPGSNRMTQQQQQPRNNQFKLNSTTRNPQATGPQVWSPTMSCLSITYYFNTTTVI